MASKLEEEEESQLLAMQMVTASVIPMVLRAALELHIFDIIADAGTDTCLSSEDIASRLRTQNPDAPHLLDCMLRLLVSHSLLTCTVLSHDHRLYGLAPASKLFVKNEDGGSLAPNLLIFQDQAFMDSWYHLKETILEGGGLPFYKAHGVNIAGYIGKDPKLSEGFKSCRFEYNVLFTRKVLDTYKGFEGVQVLVDVGGGNGQILSMIISRYPSIKGINFDLPHVIEKGTPCSVGGLNRLNIEIMPTSIRWACNFLAHNGQKPISNNCNVDSFQTIQFLGLTSLDFPFDVVGIGLLNKYRDRQGRDDFVVGMEHVGGDMFTSIPKGDAIFMKNIVHWWSHEQCLKLLKNCYEALRDNGKVIVVDLIAPTFPETNVATKGILQMEMFKLNMNNGTSKERTNEEFIALAREAGFSGINVACCAYTFSVIEFYK